MPDEETQNLSRTMRKIRRLRKGAPPTPEQIEEETRRCGEQHLIAGGTLLAVTLLIALGATALDDTPLNGDPVGLSFALLALFLAGMTGAVLTAAGLSERRGRPGRAAVLQASKIAMQNAGRLDRGEQLLATIGRMLSQVIIGQRNQGELVVGQGELMKELAAGIVEQLQVQQERLEKVETGLAAVPDFAEGVMLVTELRNRYIPPAA